MPGRSCGISSSNSGSSSGPSSGSTDCACRDGDTAVASDAAEGSGESCCGRFLSLGLWELAGLRLSTPVSCREAADMREFMDKRRIPRPPLRPDLEDVILSLLIKEILRRREDTSSIESSSRFTKPPKGLLEVIEIPLASLMLSDCREVFRCI